MKRIIVFSKPRLASMRIQFLAALFIICAIAFGLLSYKNFKDQSNEKLASIEAAQQIQSVALGQTSYQLVSQLKQKIYHSIPRLQESAYFAWEGLEEFRALALARWDNEQVVFENIQARNDSSLQKLKYFENKITKNEVGRSTHGYFLPIEVKMRSGQNAQKDILGVFSFQDRIVLALFDANLFFALIDSFKKENQDIFVWTYSGLAITHSTAEYFAKSFNTDPIYKKISTSRLTQSSMEVPLDGQTTALVSFSRIDGTNLVAVSAKDYSVGYGAQFVQMSPVLFLGLGAFLFLSLVSMLVFGKIERQWDRSLLVASAALKAAQEEKQKLQAAENAQPHSEDELDKEYSISSARLNLKEVPEELNAEVLQKHEMEKKNIVYKTTLSLAFRYLGEITLLQKSISDFEERLKELQIPLTAFNKMKEGFGHLKSFNAYLLKKLDEKEFHSNFTRLQTPVEQVLKLMQPVFVYHGIRLQTEFSSKAELQIDYMAMTRAVDSFLRFLVEQLPSTADNNLESLADENSHKREIRIRLFDDIEGSKMSIEFYRKVDSSILEKAMDPMGQVDYLVKNSLNSSVLTLSAAQGLIMAQGGQLVFRYEPHFQVIMKFPYDKTVALKPEEVVESLAPVIAEPTLAPEKATLSTPEKLKMPDLAPPLEREPEVKKDDVDLDKLLAVPELQPAKSTLLTKEPEVKQEQPMNSFAAEPVKAAVLVEKNKPSDEKNNLDSFRVQVRKPTKRVNL